MKFINIKPVFLLVSVLLFTGSIQSAKATETIESLLAHHKDFRVEIERSPALKYTAKILHSTNNETLGYWDNMESLEDAFVFLGRLSLFVTNTIGSDYSPNANLSREEIFEIGNYIESLPMSHLDVASITSEKFQKIKNTLIGTNFKMVARRNGGNVRLSLQIQGTSEGDRLFDALTTGETFGEALDRISEMLEDCFEYLI